MCYDNNKEREWRKVDGGGESHKKGQADVSSNLKF